MSHPSKTTPTNHLSLSLCLRLLHTHTSKNDERHGEQSFRLAHTFTFRERETERESSLVAASLLHILKQFLSDLFLLITVHRRNRFSHIYFRSRVCGWNLIAKRVGVMVVSMTTQSGDIYSSAPIFTFLVGSY